MATKDYALKVPAAGGQLPDGVFVVEWVLNTGDDGTPFLAPHYSDKNVQVNGTFAGSTVTIEGHDYPEGSPTYDTLHDPAGSALTFTATGLKQVLESPWGIRPKVTAGTAAGLIVRLLVHTVARR